MESHEHVIHSSHLNKEMHIIHYGHSGVPFLGFPTQCAPCTNYEDFGVTHTLRTYLEDGEMQLFSVETVDGERILRAISYWLMVDLDTKSLVNIEQKFPDITKYEKREDDFAKEVAAQAGLNK